jgi:tRNA 2-thiouridine synthesizing protein A
MERTLDARGLNCPLPLVKARAALAELRPGDVLVVLATDPEAPIDIAALAADGDHALEIVRARGHWRLVVTVGG